MSGTPLLRRLKPEEVSVDRAEPVDEETLAKAGAILADVRKKGEAGLIEYAVRFGDLKSPSDPYILDRDTLKAAFDALPKKDQDLLTRTADRIKRFAVAQRNSIKEVTIDVDGGKAGQSVSPVEIAGCYAPGGRFPLPSSVLMTAVTAAAAGVERVIVASPRPAEMTKAAAYVSGAEFLLAIGGCQAIAAFAYGIGRVPACDVIVGPGNRFVTAAKKLVSGRVSIDMLAGPSELLVVADQTADPVTVAADLLAQAEHDTDALPMFVTTDESLLEQVQIELEKQLEVLPTKANASAALKNGFAVVAKDIEEIIVLADRLAPEHLEVILKDAETLAPRFRHYGGLFIGNSAAEVLGDYGAGPNHTLPTGRTARYTGGLSVFDFLRVRTFLQIDSLPQAQGMVQDAIDLAVHEGLIGHSRSAMRRLVPKEEQKKEEAKAK